MRSELKHELAKQFEERFLMTFPQFSRDDIPEETIWAWRLAPSLTFFVMLQPADDADEFYINIAWSNDEQFPWGSFDVFPNVDSPKQYFRLQRLWSDESRSWDLAPEKAAGRRARIKAMRTSDKPLPYAKDPPLEVAMSRIPPHIDDAIQRLTQYALPLFHKVAEYQKIPWPKEFDS